METQSDERPDWASSDPLPAPPGWYPDWSGPVEDEPPAGDFYLRDGTLYSEAGGVHENDWRL